MAPAVCLSRETSSVFYSEGSSRSEPDSWRKCFLSGLSWASPGWALVFLSLGGNKIRLRCPGWEGEEGEKFGWGSSHCAGRFSLGLIFYFSSNEFLSRLVHLDVEVRSGELLVPALLCPKEPTRASYWRVFLALRWFLMHIRTFPCMQVTYPYAIKNQRKAKGEDERLV